MALFKIFRGNESELSDVPKHEGYAYFTVDKGDLYIDISSVDSPDSRVQVNAKYAQGLYDVKNNKYLTVDDLLLSSVQASVKQGGTGRDTLTVNALLIGDGENPVKMVSIDKGSVMIGDDTDGVTGIHGVGALFANTDGMPEFGILPLIAGGTGGNTAEDARTNLEVYSEDEVDDAIEEVTTIATSATLYSNGWTSENNKYVQSIAIPGLSCGKNHNVPPTVTYVTNLEEYSKIESAEATYAASKTANGTVKFVIDNKPKDDIEIIIIDAR